MFELTGSGQTKTIGDVGSDVVILHLKESLLRFSELFTHQQRLPVIELEDIVLREEGLYNIRNSLVFIE